MKSADYEISCKTYAICYKSKNECTVLEEKKEIKIKTNIQKFINYNCEYYGSSFEGRKKGSKSILGMKYKLPIIIEESREIIFFPTKAYEKEGCSWISLKNIISYEGNETTKVTFSSGIQKEFNISLESFENQILRANKLLLILKSRKMKTH